jgi:hypothetical protein
MFWLHLNNHWCFFFNFRWFYFRKGNHVCLKENTGLIQKFIVDSFSAWSREGVWHFSNLILTFSIWLSGNKTVLHQFFKTFRHPLKKTVRHQDISVSGQIVICLKIKQSPMQTQAVNIWSLFLILIKRVNNGFF